MSALATLLLIATGVLIIAGMAKILRPSATATALREISIPMPVHAARLLGVLEVALGVVAIASGSRIAWAGVAMSYAAFSVFILWALANPGRVGTCGCFGRDDTPPTPAHLVFNAVSSALAFLAVFDPVRVTDIAGTAVDAAVAVVILAVGIGVSILALTVLPRSAA